MQFPLRWPLGNRVPFRGRIPGCTFRLSGVAETVSRFEASIWDALSGTAPMGKARPISAPWPVPYVFLDSLVKQKNRLEREFQPVIYSSKCRIDYDCAPSRKKRRLK